MSESRMDMQASSLGTGEDDPRHVAAKLVNALYRLVKACQLHAENNQAVAQVVDYVVATVAQYSARSGASAAAILFTPHAVFVNRQMLKASRETYQLAIELGAMVQPCDVTEITLSREVTATEVAEFGRIVAAFTREGKKSPKFTDGGWEALKLRKVVGLGAATDMTPPVRAARTYAAALMIVRGFYGDLKRGKYELRQGIKRVAQKLVSQFDTGSSTGGRLLLSIAATPSADADRSSVLLSSAILALAMTNQLTNDRSILTALTGAAILYDTGRQRLVGYETEGGKAGRVLNSDEELLLPTSSLVALTALGKLHPPNIVRSVIVHEALALRDGPSVYQGRRSPLLLSRILGVARSFTELRVPRPGHTALGIDDAIQVLEAQASDNVGRTLVKLVTGALGIFPAGTMVELNTGEMGVVLSTPMLPVDFARPPVRILYDDKAQLIADPIDVDLALPVLSGESRRFIRRPIDATDQQMKQMRAYVMQLATKRARKKSLSQMQAVQPPSQVSAHSSDMGSSSHSGGAGGFPSFGGSSVSGNSAHSSSMGGASSSARDSQLEHSRGSFDDSFGGSAPISSVPGEEVAARGAATIAPRQAPPSPQGEVARGLPTVAPRAQVQPGPEADRRAPTVRPATRRWDPRSEEGAAAELRAPVVAPHPEGPKPPTVETRSVDWKQYGQELVSAVGKPLSVHPEASARLTPPSGSPAASPIEDAPVSDTDAILAAYLSEEGLDSSQGDSGARSHGLRWSGPKSDMPGPMDNAPSSDVAAREAAARSRETTQRELAARAALARELAEREAKAASDLASKAWAGRNTTGPRPQVLDRDSSVRDSAGSVSNAGLRWGGRSSSQGSDSSQGRNSSQGSDSFSGGDSLDDGPASQPPPGSHRSAPTAAPAPAARAPKIESGPEPKVLDAAQAAPVSRPAEPIAASTLRTGPRSAGASAWASPASRKPPSDEAQADAHKPAPSSEEAPAPMSTESAASRRAKAGSMSWGTPRRDGKK